MVIYIASLLGVAFSACSGALEAGHKKFDLMGVTVVAIITAIGGGTIRDLLLGQKPVFWIGDPNFLIVATFSAVITFYCARIWAPKRSHLLVTDALGLALFAIGGARLAEIAGTSFSIQIMMGTITGAAGGVIRDVLCAEVPLLFRPTETLYATAAIAGIVVYQILQLNGVNELASMLVGMAIIAGLRFLAIVFGLRLPEFRISNRS